MDSQVCPHCGAENETQAAWCENCLYVFQESGRGQVLFCPHCGHENSYEENYCEECYEPLKPGQVE